jgi:hypothetical protein
MDSLRNTSANARQSLPSLGRLFVFAVAVPAAVAISNQVLFEFARSLVGLRIWLYPWMALSTAVLSWCSGRYLSPAWLRWAVFAWCLVLLDCLTMAACLRGPLAFHFAYVLIQSQISLLSLWAILSTMGWQWRLPGVVATVPIVVLFAQRFRPYWGDDWGMQLILTALVIAILCGTLRIAGFALWHVESYSELHKTSDTGQTHQFSLKHLLAWMAAMVPLLIIFRGFDSFVLQRLGGPDLLGLALIAIIVACANLISVWGTLGNGLLIARVMAVLLVPYLLGVCLVVYLEFVELAYRSQFYRGGMWVRGNPWFDSLLRDIYNVRGSLVSWMWSNAALLAALLLFLRAGGYRLVRNGGATD